MFSPLVHGPSSNAEWLWIREIATGVGANHIIIYEAKGGAKILTRDVVDGLYLHAINKKTSTALVKEYF